MGVNVASSMCWTYVSHERLIFGAIGPSWRGIRSICKDADTAELIDSFAFLASQYVVRSNLVRSIGGLVLVFDEVCDFRAADLRRTIVGPQSAFRTVQSARELVESEFPKSNSRGSRKSREFQGWINCLNPVDPVIHRAVFQFWKAKSLWIKEFSEEAIGALDSITSIASEAIRAWGLCSKSPSRPDVGAFLGMSKQDCSQLARLYLLRCSFGAHPPMSKWWDFHEMYEDELEGYFGLQQRLLGKLATFEAGHRRVDPEPRIWSKWFVDNAEMLLDVVWFTRVP